MFTVYHVGGVRFVRKNFTIDYVPLPINHKDFTFAFKVFPERKASTPEPMFHGIPRWLFDLMGKDVILFMDQPHSAMGGYIKQINYLAEQFYKIEFCRFNPPHDYYYTIPEFKKAVQPYLDYVKSIDNPSGNKR